MKFVTLLNLCWLQYKLCKVRKVQTGPKGIPFLVTHDGRTIRYPDPLIKVRFLPVSLGINTECPTVLYR